MQGGGRDLRSHEFDHDPPVYMARGSHLDYSPGVRGSRYAYPHVCSNNWEAIRVPRNNPSALRSARNSIYPRRPIDVIKISARRLFVARGRNQFAIAPILFALSFLAVAERFPDPVIYARISTISPESGFRKREGEFWQGMYYNFSRSCSDSSIDEFSSKGVESNAPGNKHFLNQFPEVRVPFRNPVYSERGNFEITYRGPGLPGARGRQGVC